MGFNISNGGIKVPLTVYVSEETYNIIEDLSNKSKRSLSNVTNSMIEYAIENMENREDKK